MGLGTQETSNKSENRRRHAIRGERRVAEMECHVKCLREKLDRLEKMLPQDVPHEQIECETCCPAPTNTCPIDEIAKREQFLRKQIYDMECTEQSYMRQIADFKSKPSIEEVCSNYAGVNCSGVLKKNRDAVTKERLSLLDSYSQKLCNNLQCIKKNHVDLTQEAQNLSKVLEKSRRDDKKCNENEVDNNESKRNVSCACNNFAKRKSFIPCHCNEWEDDLEIKDHKGKNNKREDCCAVGKKKIVFKENKCSCCETSSSSDSEGLCDCQLVHKNQLNNINKSNSKDLDEYSCSSEDKTLYSETSKCTCFCSKNHSHEDLEDSDSDGSEKQTVTRCPMSDRFRGGVDILKTKASLMCVEDNYKPTTNVPSIKNAIVDHLKLIKVDELREGLERLKIRNRNLKDFLQTLESPFSLVNQSSETTSVCTEVSSCYTLDMARQTRSGLLTVVKVLEGKCRSKDAIIVALTDELKSSSSKRFRLKPKETNVKKAEMWKLTEDKENDRKFSKKDSVLGFLVFVMILISHLKRSEVLTYVIAARKLFTELPPRLILLITERFSVNILLDSYEQIAKLTAKSTERAVGFWVRMHSRLSGSLENSGAEMRGQFNSVIAFVDANQVYLSTFTSLILAGALIVVIGRTTVSYFKIPELIHREKLLRKFCEPVKSASTVCLRIFQKRVVPSKFFWFCVGFGSHVLWNMVEADVFRIMDLGSAYFAELTRKKLQESSQAVEEEEEEVCELFSHLNYGWIVSVFSAKLNSLVQFSYYVLKNVIV